MDATIKDQIFNLIDKSRSILLLTHAKADCDGLGSMISMYLALQALEKEVTAATSDPAPEALSFLPSINIVQNAVSSNNFVITLDIQSTPLNKIKYKLADDHSKVNIIVTPRSGRFKAEDVSMGQEEKHFDLIITFDTGNLEHLGPLYEQNTELFFNTPLINIDHHASNTDYGQINFVDVISASTTEMMLELLKHMETRYQKKFINPDVATLLLAGLITDTGSFQHANTSPRAMEVAAQLLDLGARQQEIVKNIYKTKKLTTLKLWGTVLSKVETDPIYRLVWSSITKTDLSETGANSDESDGLIDDLLSNAPGAEVIMLFKHNEEGYVSVSMRSTTNSVDVGKICADMGGGGHVRAAGVKRRDGSSLEKLIDDTLTKVREYQGERLNIHPDMIRPRPEMPVEQKIDKKKESEAPKVASPGEQKVQYLDFSTQPPAQKQATATEAPEPKNEEIPSAPQEPVVKKEQKNEANKSKATKKTETKPQNEKNTAKKPKKAPEKSVETLTRDFVSKPESQSGTPEQVTSAPVPPVTPAPAPEPQQIPPAPSSPPPVAPEPMPTPPVVSPMPEPQPAVTTPQAPEPAPVPPPATPPINPIPSIGQNAEDSHNQEIPPAL